MKRLVFVYDDYGCSESSVRQLKESIEELYAEWELKTVKGNEIKEGILFSYLALEVDIGSRLLCIGGGFDLGYVQTLGEEGCDAIKRFVCSGGSYLGICAGAYFACDKVVFDPDGPLEVIGERKLKFFPRNSIGPVNVR